MRNTIKNSFLLILGIALTLGFTGCQSRGGSDGLSAGRISAQISFENATPAAKALSEQRSAIDESQNIPDIDICRDYLIDTIEVAVLHSNKKLTDAVAACSEHQVSLNSVPALSDLRVEFRAFSQGVVQWYAEVNGVRVDSGNNTDLGTILLQYIGDDPPPAQTISATATTGGTISPAGNVSVAFGADQTLTITPDPGFFISRLLINGTPAAPAASYTFVNVTGPRDICAEFEIATPLLHRWSFNGNLEDLGFSNAEIVDPDDTDGNGGHTLSDTQITLQGGDQAQAEYVSLGQDLLPDTAVTIELWATHHSIGFSNNMWYFGNGNTEYVRMHWNLQNDINMDLVEFRDTVKDDTLHTYGPLLLDTEYHIAMVIEPGADGSTRLTWYAAPSSGADLGSVKGTMTTSNTLAELMDDVAWLGRSPFSNEMTSNASYNEVRIWDGALTAGQLEYLHDLGPDAIRPLKLKHRWSFNNDLEDTAGGSTAEILDPNGDPNRGGTATIGSSEIQLSGGANDTSKYLNLGAGLLTGSKQYTIEIWATQEAVRNWSRIFDYGPPVVGDGGIKYIMMSWSSGTNPDSNRIQGYLGSGSYYDRDRTAPYSLAEKYHIVLVLDNSIDGSTVLRWYIAPASAQTIAQEDPLEVAMNLSDFDELSQFWLGRSRYTNDQTAQASYDEVRIWEGVLTNEAIRASHLAGPDYTADALQSSTLFSHSVAALAIDGNTDGIFEHHSVTHTWFEIQPWWQMDLWGIRRIREIRLWNRTDPCCKDRLSDFYVLVSPTPFGSNSLDTELARENVSSLFLSGQADDITRLVSQGDLLGRYLRIWLSGNEQQTLSLAEVAVTE